MHEVMHPVHLHVLVCFVAVQIIARKIELRKVALLMTVGVLEKNLC